MDEPMSSDDCRCENGLNFEFFLHILRHFYNKIVGLSENVWWSIVKFSVPFFIIFKTQV